MRNYLVYYRERGKKAAQVFETSVEANNAKEARRNSGLPKGYVVIKVRKEL